MSIVTRQFADGVLHHDPEATAREYALRERGDADNCECGICRNFRLVREIAFPPEFKQVLAELGVDYRIEDEVVFGVRTSGGLHLYQGWFSVLGEVTNRSDELTVISPTFNFHLGSSWIEKDGGRTWTNIEFDTHVPWHLEGETWEDSYSTAGSARRHNPGSSLVTGANKTIALWAIVLVAHAALTALVARVIHIPYGYFSISEFALYCAAGFFIFKTSQSMRTSIIGTAFVGLMDATVGWAASTVIGPGRVSSDNPLAHGIAVFFVVLTAAFFGWIGSLLCKALLRTDKLTP